MVNIETIKEHSITYFGLSKKTANTYFRRKELSLLNDPDQKGYKKDDKIWVVCYPDKTADDWYDGDYKYAFIWSKGLNGDYVLSIGKDDGCWINNYTHSKRDCKKMFKEFLMQNEYNESFYSLYDDFLMEQAIDEMAFQLSKTN